MAVAEVVAEVSPGLRLDRAVQGVPELRDIRAMAPHPIRTWRPLTANQAKSVPKNGPGGPGQWQDEHESIVLW